MVNNKRPSLLRYLLRQHVVAVSITLFLILLMVLFLADHLALQSAAYTMAQDIRTIDAKILFSSTGQRRIGRILIDSNGKIYRLNRTITAKPSERRIAEDKIIWSLAPAIFNSGEMQGTTSLPWISQDVVWAARTITNIDGKRYILVAWNQTSIIRSTEKMTYLLIIAAVILAVLINMFFLIRTIRGVTRTLNDVTNAGKKMADGDFAVSIPSQKTAELDELGKVISELALHLDQTLTNLHTEQDRLVRLEQAQRQFVADASHELRAPLSAAALTLDAWNDGLLTQAEHSDAVVQLRSEIKRLGRMVAQLLDLSQIESGRQPIMYENINPREISSQVVNTFSNLSGAEITIDIPDDIALVVADRDALHRILRNMLDNARRFTPNDGNITIL